ncbi:Rha family transcriptional regulator [Acinetobacter sp.]|uniref:Rha family transcriptional regulator n=1 Tax=Acinetobacter sp. TaxID=472 RepID=UPI003C77F54D
MNQITFSDQVHTQILTMSSRDISELTGKRHPDVKRDCEVIFTELELDVSKFAHIYFDSMNRQQTEYALPKDLVETLITGYSIKLRYQVIQRLHELESIRQPKLMLLVDLPSALRALADTHEQLQQAQFERESAVKAKALINNKKTATAMATASNAIQENLRLKDHIGQSKRNATVLAVERLTGNSYTWPPLKKWCKSHGVKPSRVHDERYGKVNTYPAQAWMDIYKVDLFALFGRSTP